MGYVFVTGGTGLVGSHVIRLLAESGYNVQALVRDDSSVALVESLGASAIKGRVEDEESWLSLQEAEAIVHAAALVTQQRSWGSFQAVNIQATKHAATTAVRLGVRLIHISSIAVYGRQTLQRAAAVDECSAWGQLRDTDYYARSKRMAEEVLQDMSRETDLSWVALRPCVIYGERDRVFLPRIMRSIRFGIAPLVGHGNNVLTVVYAGSVAEAVLSTLESPHARGPFNTTNDGEITQREFLTAVAAAMGRRVKFVPLPMAVASTLALAYHGVQRLLRPRSYPGIGIAAARFMAADNPFSSERANQELKWNPSTPPGTALERSVRWFMPDD